MSDTSIVNLCTDRLVSVINTEMKDNILDETSLGLARAGRLQANPLTYKLNLLVREGGSGWPDIIIPPNYPFYAPQYEMPWGESWLRRLVCEYELFLFTKDRIEAHRIANVVFSRLKWVVGNLNIGGLAGLTDTFLETAVMVHSTKLKTTEGGGPPANFIWRGDHYVEFVTNQVFE